MVHLANTDAILQSKSHAELVTMLALLKAFKLIELLVIVNNLLAITFIALSFSWQLKLLGVLVFGLGMLVMYFAIRIRVDINLFTHWDSIDIASLDEVLMSLNPTHSSGRTLTSRVLGSYSLFKQGATMWIAQSILLAFLVYFSGLSLSILHH
jgi:hypothetical protein